MVRVRGSAWLRSAAASMSSPARWREARMPGEGQG